MGEERKWTTGVGWTGSVIEEPYNILTLRVFSFVLGTSLYRDRGQSIPELNCTIFREKIWRVFHLIAADHFKVYSNYELRTHRSYISLFCFIFFQPLLVQAWIQTEGWDNQWLNLVLVCISMRLLFSSTFPLFLNFFPHSFHSFPLLFLFIEIQPFNERPPFKEHPRD